MKWELAWNDPFTLYLDPYAALIGDRRTWTTFTETVKGIVASGTLVCQRIAVHSPVLGAVKKGAQRIIRMVRGNTTKRSPDLDADHLTAQLRSQAVADLVALPSDELWLLADGSDLRKPYATAMPDLMQVRALDGTLVPGYRTLSVLGLTPQRRGILYHRLFSSTAADFVSEPHEVQQALTSVSQAIAPLQATMAVTWIVDSGFDDVAVWRTIWQQEQHVVCRLAHTDRLVEFPAAEGGWQRGSIAQARTTMRRLTQTSTTVDVTQPTTGRTKSQRVVAEIWAVPLRLTYATNVRRPGPGTLVTKPLWLVEIRLLGTKLEPWLLLTDWMVETAAQGLRILRMYRQRWGVEDSFKWTKDCLGWEEVQLLDLGGIRLLVALAWVAAGFLYQLGITLENESVQVLARLGDWEPRPNRPPGKITLTRGLRRLVDLLATDAFLQAYYRDHGPFPSRLAAFLHGWQPGDDL
jgi:Transposase DDE domain